MLKVELLEPADADRAAVIFHRDGFVALRGVLMPEQLSAIQTSYQDVIQQDLQADPERKGNRGHHRYSCSGRDEQPEWRVLMDLPTVLPVLEAIWKPASRWHTSETGGADFVCRGTGGDFSLPGAEIQELHVDGLLEIADAHGQVSIRDTPAPQITVNIAMTEFTEDNGAIRLIPFSQRSRAPLPSLADEPDWMKDCTVCVPAGTALIRDVRCWHGGTANNSDHARPMTGVSYLSPWFRYRGDSKTLSRESYEQLSIRGQEICRYLVKDPLQTDG